MKCHDKVAAEYQKKENEKTFRKKWCPAFATKCKGEKCHSFNPGLIKGLGSIEKFSFCVIPPSCSSVLVVGSNG